MEDQNKNVILAIVLSFLVVVIWYTLFAPTAPDPQVPTEVAQTTATDAQTGAPAAEVGAETGSDPEATAADDLANAPRIRIETERLSGSISLLGGRIDDLSLKGYRETTDPDSDIVRLLVPAGQNGAFYALNGWAPGAGLTFDQVPGARTLWTLSGGTTLAVGQPVTMTWNNGAGLIFTRSISVDADYLFSVTDKVENSGSGEVRLYPYGTIARRGLPEDLKRFFILHEGAVQMADGVLEEVTYADMTELDPLADEGGIPAGRLDVASAGWVGFTDHYWQAILIPAPGQPFQSVMKYSPATDTYQTDVRMPTQSLSAGASTEVTSHLFAGAKEWATIRDYENNPGAIDRLFGAKTDPNRIQIAGFVDSIDWGWFYFLTKPMFTALHWLNGIFGNMGWAIIALTFVIKLIVFPLARKSYVSMAKMKELQPEMEKIKERVGDDRQKMQMEMMSLYKREKVNPAAGCLPILLQIPIFFAIYKVIFVTLELRHAPWLGWIRDLSAPDPSSIYNFFGVLPWDTPPTGSVLHLIFLGLMPIILGITMWLQQKLNPAPTDPTQAAIFAWMPWIFMFMLGGFASGLVLYWITNNIITFAQQYTIMSMHGKRPDLFDNIRAGFKRKKPADGAPKK
jgi:YidC/Oxa1 family membrane protein insertase